MRKTKMALFQSVVALILCVSMLIGTTFAWFTDSVTTGVNHIQAGNLDVELVDAAGNSLEGVPLTFRDVSGNTDILWEPGCTFKTQGFRVKNAGNLALKYTLFINGLLGDSALLDVIDFAVEDAQGNKVDIDDFVGHLAGNTDSGLYYLVGHMDELAGNDYMGKTLSGLGITVHATQDTAENDSFGSDYDAGATFPTLKLPGSITANVTSANGLVSEALTMADDGDTLNARVPVGVKLKNNATSLTLSVTEMAASGANIELQDDEILRSLDVHIEGVAADNTVPMLITIREAMMVGLNMGNYTLYHVENGAPVAMTYVADPAALNGHNQYSYDPATGDVILSLATFSEVALVAEESKWEGNRDYSWYTNAVAPVDGEAVTEYIIANADQLAAFGAIVGGMAEGIKQDSFSGKAVKLIADINLGDKESENNPDIIFYPIGYNSSDGKYEKTGVAVTTGFYNFCGTFDGNGHSISNFYHNTWEMKGDNNYYDATLQYYRDGMGLFGRVYKGTIKNLTVKNFSSDGEYTTTGAIAAYADGATFENITIFNCNPRVYNIGNGGIVGCVGWYAKDAGLTTTFKNITVDNSNKISALWGSYDVACGGIVGQYYPTSGQTSANKPANGGISFENCHVAAQMDVYNDVCANYQYYAYRYTGMLIGSVRENETINGHSYPKMDGITAKDCTVHFGTWNDYYYCELVDNTTASYTHDYQMSRLTEIKAIDGTTITYLDGTTGTVPASGRANYVIVDYEKGHGTENATCYHFKDGKVWSHEDGGKEIVNGVEVLKEDKQHIYLEFNNLVTGYGWGVTTKVVGELKGVTILDREVADSVDKFKPVVDNNKEFESGFIVTIGDIFAAIEGADVDIKPDNVQVTVSPFGATSTAGGAYEANTTDWTQGTLTFSGVGQAVISITDYYFCKTATVTVNIVGAEKFDTKFDKDFLYRVGNADKSTVALGTIFKHSGKGTIHSDSVEVTFTTVAGNANGTFTANTTDWTKGTIQFTGTGVVKVTIKDATSKEFVLHLEVVDAKNITSVASSTDGTDVVLLDNVKISSNGTVHYQNCIVYGNGFTFDVRGGMNQYNSKQGHGIIIINNATLDHLKIVGDVYKEYGMYTTNLTGAVQNDYTAAIDATNSIIQNCYIANCATPIRSNGNTIIDTTLYGGTVANLLISGGTNVLTNVTTVNYNDGRGVIGMGIVITDGANPDSTKLILNGYLKQYNYVYESDISEITVDDAKTVFNSMFENQFANYHIVGNSKAVNTGIISIHEDINLVDDVLIDNANTGYAINNNVTVTFSAYGLEKTVGAAVASVTSSGKVDNNYVDNGNEQGDYLPKFEFALGDQLQAKDNEDDTRYLIGDKNGLTAMSPKGEAALTLDLTKLAAVSKYDGTSYLVGAKCIGPDGTEQTGVVTLDTKGTYKLVFTVQDDLFYDKEGNKINKSVTRTYEVLLVLDLYEKSIADATMTISSSALTGEYISSGTNKKYKMYPLKAITNIMDDANKDGTLETFNFKANIQSAVLTPEGNNAFSSPTTITITYTGGQVLTIVLGTPSGLNSPGASNGGKTFSVKTDSTNGIYLQSDGAVASGSAATGTWPITSWSFKGTSGKVITDNTQVTINFTKPSGGGCVTGNTLVTLADGTQKRIDEVTYADQLLVWNFYTGEYDVAPASIIMNHGYDNYTVVTLNFDDGTTVNTINGHGFFDVSANKYVILSESNAADYIGHEFVKMDGDGYATTKLVSYSVKTEYTESWSILTAEQYNCILEGMWTVTPAEVEGSPDYLMPFEIGDGMKYDEAKMQADIEKYGLYTYEDFAAYMTEEQFNALGLATWKVAVGKGYITWADILYLISIHIGG